MILEHIFDEPIVLKHNESVEVPQAALKVPLVKHYIEVKRLELMPPTTKPTEVILSR
jgi:hypothetical protein